MPAIVQSLFFLLIVKPLTLIVLGLSVRHRELLPAGGPAIIVANHNSHLDTLVLMSLFPARLRRKIRPIAAADYFLKNRYLAWFSKAVFHIVPIARSGDNAREDFLAAATQVLDEGNIVILYPEGTRGEPEELSKFKSGIATLAQARSQTLITPVFMRGLGKALPRGERVLVPFFCDVVVGEAIKWSGERANFMQILESRLQMLAAELAPEG